MNFRFPMWIQPREDSSVFLNHMVDSTNVAGGVCTELMVMGGPAMVRAELFIPPTMYFIIAFFAIPNVGGHNTRGVDSTHSVL